MNKAYIILSLALFTSLLTAAKDAVVVFRVDETNAKTVKFEPILVNAEDFSTLAKAELNDADSTFVFRNYQAVGQPAVLYQIDDNYSGEQLSQTSDTTTIYIPAFYLKAPEELKELTVTASDRHMSAEKDTYIPTTTSKRISSDGTELLQNIGIPSLSISPVDGTMTSVTGKPVSTFIDYMPASRTDVRNIRAEDVKRVDVYDSPSDPRFGGARYVVNFVMVEYVFGGYSKFKAGQSLATGYSNGTYSAYSKFTYKKMTYDVGIDAGYSHNRHGGTTETAEYRFPEQSVGVQRNIENFLADKHNVSAFFRALYKTDKTSISNLFGVKSDKMPKSSSDYSERFSSPDYVSGTSSSTSNQSGLSLSWEGNYQFILPNSFTLILKPQASYGTQKSTYGYMASNGKINNYADETMWEGYFGARLQKMLGKHSVSAQLYAEADGNDIDYTGTTTAKQRGRDYYSGLHMEGQLTFGNLSLQPSVTLYINRKEIDAIKETNAYLKYYVAANYLLNSKNRLSFSSEFSQMGAPQNSRLDGVLYQNQIDAIAGNPVLKKMYFFNNYLSYTFNPVSQFSATAYGTYMRQGNPLSYAFISSEYDGRDVMIRKYGNGGDWDAWTYGISANAFLIDRKLSLAVNAYGKSMTSRSLIPGSGTVFFMFANARYTISDFYVSVIYQHKYKSISQMGTVESPALYAFLAGWGNGNWQLQAMVANPFRKSFDSDRFIIDVDNYHSDITQKSVTDHCRFSLSATYSFSYGKKKVSASEGISGPAGVESQMLK